MYFYLRWDWNCGDGGLLLVGNLEIMMTPQEINEAVARKLGRDIFLDVHL